MRLRSWITVTKSRCAYSKQTYRLRCHKWPIPSSAAAFRIRWSLSCPISLSDKWSWALSSQKAASLVKDAKLNRKNRRRSQGVPPMPSSNKLATMQWSWTGSCRRLKWHGWKNLSSRRRCKGSKHSSWVRMSKSKAMVTTISSQWWSQSTRLWSWEKCYNATTLKT